jgi:hypothetical protein
MTVQGEIRGAEDDGAVEDGQDLPLAARHVAIPQLEMPPVLLLPVLVEVDEQVEPAIELQQGVPVEVHVHLEEAAGKDLMRPRAAVVGVRNEPFDPGQRLQEPQDGGGIHLVEEELQVGRQRRLVPVAELLLGGVVESPPIDLVRPGKLGKDRLQDLVRKQIVDHDVGERLRRDVLRLQRARVGVES